tara:strand:- start:434 stop:1267 length:834 start_codon:yes stop_codon:yes gene_type:complete
MREYTYQWNPEAYTHRGKEPILKITKSSFGSFQWCPKKYEFSYVQRLPQDQTEAMRKGTIVHNAREEFFNSFDIKKADTYSHSELVAYCLSLYPIDEYVELYENMAIVDANRFMEAKEGEVENYLPVVNEICLDAEINIGEYTVHLQGIIDRMFLEGESHIPMELKTGPWKEYKTTSMRKEMAFYKLLFDNCPNEILEEHNINPDIPITHWGWYYPQSHYITVEPVKPRSETAVIKGIEKLIEAYEEGVFPTKFFHKTCSHCSFYGICDAANTESWV